MERETKVKVGVSIRWPKFVKFLASLALLFASVDLEETVKFNKF